MTNITAPSMPSGPLSIGKTIRGADGSILDVFGYPLPNYLGDVVDGMEYPWTITNQTTYFDLSNLDINHEVVVIGYRDDGFIGDAFDMTVRWRRVRDNKIVFERTIPYEQPPVGYGWQNLTNVAWIGYCTEDSWYQKVDEIAENGAYKGTFILSGGKNYTGTIDFVVVGIPPSTLVKNETTTTLDWLVRTSNYFDSSNYIRVGICTQNFTDGQSSAPSGIVDYVNAPSSNVGCAGGTTVTGLNEGTTYTFYGFAQAANGNYYRAGSYTITTLGTKKPSYAPGLDYRVEGGFRVLWGSSSNASSYQLGVRRGYDNYVTTFDTTNRYLTVNGLQYGVTYYVKVRAYGNGDYSDYTSENPVTTAPKTPTISEISKTNNLISIGASSMEGNFDEILIERYSSSSVYIDTKKISKSSYDAGNRTVIWSGLPGGNTYIFKARSVFTVNSVELLSVNYSNNLSITTIAVEKWEWYASKTLGANLNITATEWNAFQDRINEALSSKGENQFSYFNYYNGDNSFTRASPGGDIMAYHFNQARNAINGMAPVISIPSAVSPGDSVTAAGLNRLRDSLNSVL